MSQHLYQRSNSSTSTLRPRNARLISYLDEYNSTSASHSIQTPGSGGDAPLRPGRSTSPVTNCSPAQPVNAGTAANRRKPTHNRSTSDHAASTGAYSQWGAWSSIQEITTTLLGSNVQPAPRAKGKQSGRSKTPALLPGQWGPPTSGISSPAAGSVEDRLSLVQTKKREALLLANANAGRDAFGKYKRRDSISDVARHDYNGQDEDALVYLHRVQNHDTMAGVTIKYGCQAEAFRKVNRFWPNDSIQIRKHVLLPVESCSVRGKKLNEVDLLSSGLETATLDPREPLQDEICKTSIDEREVASPPNQLPSITSLIEHARHESWMQIAKFPEPVELLRLSRRSLGYFPPARRKSVTARSDTSTPRTSFDMLRHPPTHTASMNASPVRRPRLSSQSSRQQSSTSAVGTPSLADQLKGPGGIGSLRGLRTEPACPGPAPDPLNRKFAQYLPDLAPPENFPRSSLRPTPRATPRASIDSIRSTSSAGLGEMSGAIEGWVRKFATAKGPKSLPNKMGDLIELETNSEMGDLLEEEDGEQTPVASTVNKAEMTATEEALLNQRFPVRGRIRTAYAALDMDKGG